MTTSDRKTHCRECGGNQRYVVKTDGCWECAECGYLIDCVDCGETMWAQHHLDCDYR